MGVEFELKFLAEESVFEELKKESDCWVTYDMATTYYDTPDGQCSQRYWTLRRRFENGLSVCTLKTPAGIDGRCEYEWSCEDIHDAIPHLCRLSGSNALAQLVERGLVELCGARFTRTARPFCAGCTTTELALDQGVLMGGGRELPFAEMELELKAGDPQELNRIAQTIAHRFGLEQETKSKFARAKRLSKEV